MVLCFALHMWFALLSLLLVVVWFCLRQGLCFLALAVWELEFTDLSASAFQMLGLKQAPPLPTFTAVLWAPQLP